MSKTEPAFLLYLEINFCLLLPTATYIRKVENSASNFHLESSLQQYWSIWNENKTVFKYYSQHIVVEFENIAKLGDPPESL